MSGEENGMMDGGALSPDAGGGMAAMPEGVANLAEEALPGGAGAVSEADWTLDAKAFDGMEIDPAFIDRYGELARKYGMDRENATSLLKDAAAVMNRMDAETVSEQARQWQLQSRNDREFGGSAIDANLSVAKRALDTYGTPELRELMEATGMGNHPEVIRFFFRVGKTLMEDGFIPSQGGRAVSSFDEAARQLFGSR